jgi:hypothetical protein
MGFFIKSALECSDAIVNGRVCKCRLITIQCCTLQQRVPNSFTASQLFPTALRMKGLGSGVGPFLGRGIAQPI